MKTPTITCVAVLGVLLVAGATAAQPSYDIVNYFLTQPGSFNILQWRNPGAPPAGRDLVGVLPSGKYMIHLWYSLDSQNKPVSLNDADVFEVTPTHLVYYGTRDFKTGQVQLVTPPIRVPRNLALNQPYVYTGKEGNTPIVFTLVITADNVSYTTPRNRTFTNCLRIKTVTLKDQQVESSSDVWAPGKGTVYSVYTEIDHTEPEPKMISTGIDEYILP